MKTAYLFLAVLLILPGFGKPSTSIKEDPGKCDKSKSGKTAVVTGRNNSERALMCLKNNGKYTWRTLDSFPTLGEFFKPAEDCSDIVTKRRNAKSGLYWIKGFGLTKPKKVWCDLTTDGGGFMLVGYKSSPVLWSVPSNPSLVTPQGKPHWSSAFGNVLVMEFRIKVSKTNRFADTKADWLYRFTTPRQLGKLLINGKQSGCTNHRPGIGEIKYVKDLLAKRIVTKKFRCSRFGPDAPQGFGWNMMNTCLKKSCKSGFAYSPGGSRRNNNYGAFSYSTKSSRSGLLHNSTVFIGCEYGKCCACFGPKGVPRDFCAPGCQSINGGTVSQKSHVWFWVRSSLPKRPVWKKCTEFQVRIKGKIETHFVDETTGVLNKGSCSKKGTPNIVPAVVDVDNKTEMDRVPLVKGLLSYRKDNDKLYLSNGQRWEALGKEKQDNNLENRLIFQERETKSSQSVIFEPGRTCKDILSNRKTALSGIHWIKPKGPSSKKFRVYCDMITYGGGWTLVYSYTFTNYQNFASGSNAVNPFPNWPAPAANVPISTTPPLDESSRGAIDYNLWKDIGKEFMVMSNINDWIVCQENGGSMVRKIDGGLSCKNIKNVATKCQGVVPTRIIWYRVGPGLMNKSAFIYDFVGYTDGSDWPDHDPCSTGKPNQKQGVLNPGGAIYHR